MKEKGKNNDEKVKKRGKIIKINMKPFFRRRQNGGEGMKIER
jgi:hypothetical protein